MSRRSVEYHSKVAQMVRKNRTDFHVLIPDRIVHGKGIRGGWRVTEQGLKRFSAINTNKICTLAKGTKTGG